MSEQDDTKKLFALYDLMENKLGEMNMSFDEFTILYKSFRNPTKPTTAHEDKANNPFPWAQAAGTGWS